MFHQSLSVNQLCGCCLGTENLSPWTGNASRRGMLWCLRDKGVAWYYEGQRVTFLIALKTNCKGLEKKNGLQTSKAKHNRPKKYLYLALIKRINVNAFNFKSINLKGISQKTFETSKNAVTTATRIVICHAIPHKTPTKVGRHRHLWHMSKLQGMTADFLTQLISKAGQPQVKQYG